MNIDRILNNSTDMLQQAVSTKMLKKSLNHEQLAAESIIEQLKVSGIGNNIDVKA